MKTKFVLSFVLFRFLSSEAFSLSKSITSHHQPNKRLGGVATTAPSFPHLFGLPSENEANSVESIFPVSKDSSVVDVLLLLTLSTAFFTFVPGLPADAATGAALPKALWAYGHYVAQLIAMACLVAERTLIKPGMTKEEESFVRKIDFGYLASLALLIGTGYIRTTQFGKGLNFYGHEPLFWLKMSFIGVQGALAIFPAVTYFKRSSQTQSIDPMSEKLAKRMQQILNAEISAVLSIPLLATLMARGVGYMEGFPAIAGEVFTALATGGAIYLYGTQALTWSENDPNTIAEEDS